MLIDAAKSVVKLAAGAGLGMLIHAVTVANRSRVNFSRLAPA